MALFALIKNGTQFLETRLLPSQPPDVPSKGLSWLPFVETYPAFDPATQTLEPATTTIQATQVLRTAVVRNLTTQELDDRKTAQVTAIQRVMFEVAFNHENRIRVLQGLGTITRTQFTNALKALL